MEHLRPKILKGNVWVISDELGKLIDDIDTDMIFHNAHLAITDGSLMGSKAFGNLKGWEDFPRRETKGSILVLGKNFGSGSSRQQAVDCFVALNVQGLLAESFGAIYKRNAVNSGLPILSKIGFATRDSALAFSNGDTVEIDLESSNVKNLTKNFSVNMEPFSKVQMDIYQAGNLFEYGKKCVPPK